MNIYLWILYIQTQITNKMEFWFFHYKKIHYFQIFLDTRIVLCFKMLNLNILYVRKKWFCKNCWKVNGNDLSNHEQLRERKKEKETPFLERKKKKKNQARERGDAKMIHDAGTRADQYLCSFSFSFSILSRRTAASLSLIRRELPAWFTVSNRLDSFLRRRVLAARHTWPEETANKREEICHR